jgi:hypothetical protein
MADVDVGTNLAQYLRGRHEVAGIVGARFYPDAAPVDAQACQLGDYCTYSLISYAPDSDLSGGINFAQTRVQVDSCSLIKTRAELLRGRVKDLLVGFRGRMAALVVRGCEAAGKFDTYLPPVVGENGGVYVRSADFLISHLE